MNCRKVIQLCKLSKRVKDQEYVDEISMACERIEHQVLKDVEEEWKEFMDAVLMCATEVC